MRWNLPRGYEQPSTYSALLTIVYSTKKLLVFVQLFLFIYFLSVRILQELPIHLSLGSIIWTWQHLIKIKSMAGWVSGGSRACDVWRVYLFTLLSLCEGAQVSYRLSKHCHPSRHTRWLPGGVLTSREGGVMRRCVGGAVWWAQFLWVVYNF